MHGRRWQRRPRGAIVESMSWEKLRVPADVSFIGFDDIEAGQWFKPALSTLRPPLRDVGGRAIDLLLKAIEDPRRKPEQVPLLAKLVLRDSCGPAPKN